MRSSGSRFDGGMIGPAGVPALAEALKDRDADVHKSAVDALGGREA